MTLFYVTLPNGDIGSVNPEAVEFLRPLNAAEAEAWPANASTLIYLASGHCVAVRDQREDIIMRCCELPGRDR